MRLDIFRKKLLKIFVFNIFSLFLVGCSGPYMGKDLFGADEFVLDSYKIREGKLSILEMEGFPCQEFDEMMLEEYQDRIREDDILQIVVYSQKRKDVVDAVDAIGLRIGYRIGNGEIILPDLEPIHVVGLTLEEARSEEH